MPTINRPTVTIETLDNDRFTYSVTADNWQNKYVRRNSSNDHKMVKKLAKAFENSFDKEATLIENGATRPHNIMNDLVANQLFRRVRKLDDTFQNI